MRKTINYTDYLKESLRDSKEVEAYLSAALETGDISLFTLALKDVVDGLWVHNP